ncbi:type VI secretion system baseplate subunit TssK [Massilia sp. CF038]|uniref:type VI secretion system baseplate subunit TssK n=1 Tax=Massilia sp. CF038 TaxID=1881045 RepID=UPI0009187158|nr:type VI secretion system baseplate subunit TssK [Massilia sp. CF038]SHH10272.1 Type VI secretion, VC_A0110, EvfL, ImpJ, VasE [Massilia sp. CF038]
MSELNEGRLVAQPDAALLWHDGLLLEPTHFQQMCQRQEQLVSYHVRSAAPYNWGVRQLVIGDRTLATNVFSLSALEAIMPDGLLVAHRPGTGSLELVLSEALRAQLSASAQHATICLAVPLNDAMDRSGRSARSMPVPLPGDGDDEALTGLARVRPQMRLALDSELAKQASDAVLPLARIRCVEGRCTIERFMPPALDSRVAPPWPDGLSFHARSAALADAMQRTLNYLLVATRVRPVGLEDQLRWLELRQRVCAFGAAIAPLRGVLGLDAAAPVDLYLAWCAALGALGALDAAGAVLGQPLPVYRHLDPAATFDAIFARAEALLRMADLPFTESAFTFQEQEQYYLHPFQEQARYRWPLTGDTGSVLIIGLRGLSEEQAVRWMERAVITAACRQADWRAGRRVGAARSLIRSDGSLAPLSDALRDSGRKVQLHGMSTPGLTLFAIDPERDYPGDTDIVLENGTRNGAIDAVLFRHQEHA